MDKQSTMLIARQSPDFIPNKQLLGKNDLQNEAWAMWLEGPSRVGQCDFILSQGERGMSEKRAEIHLDPLRPDQLTTERQEKRW